MFEESLIESSRLSRRSGRRVSLPLSIALHVLVIGAAIGASLWFVEDASEPPVPVIFYSPGPPPAPPAADSRTVSDSIPSVDRDGPADASGVPGSTGDGKNGQIGPDLGAETPLRPGGDVRPPLLLDRVEPAYPEIARRLHVQGIVILEAVITAEGAVQDVSVLKSADPILDEAAKRAVLQWRYKPATLNGRAVRVYLTVTVSFRLH